MYIMPVKTIPVLIVSFLFIFAGGSITALLVEGATGFNLMFAVIIHLASALLIYYIVNKNKKKSPLFGLSLGLWIIVAIVGYGFGLLLLFLA